jgi:hypothetical protein
VDQLSRAGQTFCPDQKDIRSIVLNDDSLSEASVRCTRTRHWSRAVERSDDASKLKRVATVDANNLKFLAPLQIQRLIEEQSMAMWMTIDWVASGDIVASITSTHLKSKP